MKILTKTTEKVSKILLVLMFSISQFSFPLEVLAEELTKETKETVQEELTENEETTETKEELTENEETTETKEEQTDSNENVEEISEEEEEESKSEIENDNSETEEDETTGNEDEELDNEEDTEDMEDSTETEESILSSCTELTYVDGTYYVKGSSNYLTVTEVLSNFDEEKLASEMEATLSIIDLEENPLEESSTIENGYKVVVLDTNGERKGEYSLQIEGDYNNDSLVTEEDAKVLIDKILADETNILNEDQPFSILDATNPVFTTGSWENTIENQDTLDFATKNSTEILFGDQLVVKFYINGFNYDSLTGIQGKINYDKTLLELKEIEIENIYGDINEDGKFAYLLDHYQSNDVLMTMTFSTLGAGTTKITLEDIIASTGTNVEFDTDYYETATITILDYGIGGDGSEEEEDSETETESTTTTPSTTEATTETTSETTLQTVVATTSTVLRSVALSSDNTIKSLTIKGYKISFDPNTYEYSITVKNSVRSLNLTIELNDENASYTVTGNEKFQVGENTVTITVTAEDGSTKDYTIKVKRKEAEEETDETEEVEESSASKTIIIVLIVLVIIGLIYVIFKDDEEDKKESNK